jgi:hypothetical protein
MKEIKLFNGDNVITFGVGTRKFIFGSSDILKDRILKTFRHAFMKEEDSEYAIENNAKISIWYDGSPLSTKHTEYYELSHIHLISEELKLKTKSLFTNMLLQALQKIEYSDEFSTLRILFDDLHSEIEEELPKINDTLRFTCQMKTLDSKALLKLIEIGIEKQKSQTVPSDLNTFDTIAVQLKALTFLAKSYPEKNYFGFIYLPSYNAEIDELTKNITTPNLHLIFFPSKFEVIPPINEILLLNKNIIDCSNEISLYNDLLMPFPKQCEKSDIEQYIHQYLSSKVNENTIILQNLL